MNSIKNELKQKHEAFGGMVFLSVTLLSMMIMLFILRAQFASTSVAEANQVAYFEAQKMAQWMYSRNYKDIDGTYASFTSQNYKETISPSKEYQQLMLQSGVSNDKYTLNNSYVRWSSKTRTLKVQFPKMKNKFGDEITPQVQYIVVEKDS